MKSRPRVLLGGRGCVDGLVEDDEADGMCRIELKISLNQGSLGQSQGMAWSTYGVPPNLRLRSPPFVASTGVVERSSSTTSLTGTGRAWTLDAMLRVGTRGQQVWARLQSRSSEPVEQGEDVLTSEQAQQEQR